MSVPCDSMPREALRAVRDRPKTPRGALRATFSRRTQCLTRHPRGGGRPSACRHAARGIPRDARGARIAPRDEAVARGALRALCAHWRYIGRCAKFQLFRKPPSKMPAGSGESAPHARKCSFSKAVGASGLGKAAKRCNTALEEAISSPISRWFSEKLKNHATGRMPGRGRGGLPRRRAASTIPRGAAASPGALRAMGACREKHCVRFACREGHSVRLPRVARGIPCDET